MVWTGLDGLLGWRLDFLMTAAVFTLMLSSVASAGALVASAAGQRPAQRVLVIGANGQTGGRVMQLLKDSDGKYEPVAMIHRQAQRAKFDEMGVAWLLGDIDAGAPNAHHMDDIDAVIFAAGAGRVRGPLMQVLVDLSGAIRSVVAAQQAESVRRFILLSGINTDIEGTRRSVASTDFGGPLASWHKLKAHSEIYLRESHLYGRELDWTILCPGRLVDDPDAPGTGRIKASLIHGEEDLKAALSPEEGAAAIQSLPGSHDGKVERLCCSRDNVAETLVELLDARSTVGQSITLADGVVPVREELAALQPLACAE